MSRLLENLVEVYAQILMEHGPFDTFPPRRGSTLSTQMPEHGLEVTPEVHNA